MSRLLRVVGPLPAALILLSSCKHEVPPAGEDARVPTAEVAPAAPPAATPATATAATAGDSSAAAPAALPAAGTNRYDEAKFDLTAQPSGNYSAGQEGAVEIVLNAKPPFHANQQYPYKFKAKDGQGVKFAQPVIGKDAAKLEAQRVTMRVPFTPDGAGKRSVSGQFAFSVCTEETCLMEKRDLTLVVDVK
ncbi:MAG TPA: hypothetical protein VGQ57_06865 [Polyangiaceae bacterium]|nr:hypothetical protein [Polyangiaceae bacterium]